MAVVGFCILLANGETVILPSVSGCSPCDCGLTNNDSCPGTWTLMTYDTLQHNCLERIYQSFLM